MADEKANWIEKGVAEAGASIVRLDNVTGVKARGGTRLTSKYDPATVLESSAKVFYDPDLWKNESKGFGHDYHNLARQYHRFDEADGRPRGADPNYRRPQAT